MRKYPPVPFSVRYVMRDTEVENYKLDGGTYIAIGPLVLHNDERYWDRPDTYNPERFLDTDELLMIRTFHFLEELILVLENFLQVIYLKM